MSCTVDQLIAKCEEAISKGVKYVYGAKWQTLTKAQIQSLRAQYGSGAVWPSDDNKAGHICCDCSGLISAATGSIKGSSQYKSTALQVLPIAQRTPEMRGWAVWMQGHIGVYDGANGYYAMDGSARNAVHLPLSSNNFTHIIKLCDVTYNQKTAGKSIEEIADEVIAGKWGSNPERKVSLEAAGYNYSEVQAAVNAKVKTSSVPDKIACEYTARTLNLGWGNRIPGPQTAWNANDAITDIAIAASKVGLKYQVHILGGKWLPWVTGYNINDANNGYAGDHKMIDAVRVEYKNGSHRAKYRVATVGKDFWSYQYNAETGGGQDGYAGDFGQPIIKFEMEIV